MKSMTPFFFFVIGLSGPLCAMEAEVEAQAVKLVVKVVNSEEYHTLKVDSQVREDLYEVLGYYKEYRAIFQDEEQLLIGSLTGFQEVLECLPGLVKKDSSILQGHLIGLDYGEKFDAYEALLHEARFLGLFPLVEAFLTYASTEQFSWLSNKNPLLTIHLRAQAQEPFPKVIDVALPDKYEKALLERACWDDNTDIVDLLLQAGAPVEGEENGNRTPLMAACWKRNLVLVRRLLQAGADVDIQDKDGKTALTEAAFLGDTEMVQLLLEVSHRLALRDVRGNSALAYACLFSNKNVELVGSTQYNLAIAESLLKAGADPNELIGGNSDKANEPNVSDITREGTLLMKVTNSGYSEVVSLLLRYGAEVDAVDHLGQTALYRAVMKGKEDVVRMVLEAGADVNKADLEENTALHYAVRNKLTNVVGLFLGFGADVSIKNSHQQTAWDYGVSFSRGYASKELSDIKRLLEDWSKAKNLIKDLTITLRKSKP